MEKTLIFLREKQVNSHAYHWNCQQSAFLSSRLGYIVRLYCSFHYLFIPPSRGADPVFIPDGHTHTHTHTRAGRKMGMAMEVNFGKVRPCISTKDFVLVYLEYVCIFVRIRIKVTEWLQKLRVYNTSPLEKIEFKSEKKKKSQSFETTEFLPLFSPPLLYYTEIHSRRGSFVNVSLPR